MNLNKEQKKVLKRLNNDPQLKHFKDTFIMILVFKYMDICADLSISPANNDYFKRYMKSVVDRFKIMIKDLEKERGGIDEENEN